MMSSASVLLRMGKLIAALTAATTSAGCSGAACSQYETFVRDQQRYEEIVAWADENVFSRAFSKDDLWVGHLSGPGRWGAVSIERSSLKPPSGLQEDEIRLIGREKFQAHAVFVGGSSYRGVVIVRTTFDECSSATEVERGAFFATREQKGSGLVSCIRFN